MFLFLEYVSTNKTQTYSSHTHAYSLFILVLWAWDPRFGKRQTCFSIRMPLLCRWCVNWVWTCSKSSAPSFHLRSTHAANKKRDSWIINCHKFIINPIKHWGCRWLPGSATHWLGMKDLKCFLKAFVEAEALKYSLPSLCLCFGIFKLALFYQSAFFGHTSDFL